MYLIRYVAFFIDDMKDRNQKIDKSRDLFWGSIFKKPHLAGYYLSDWQALLDSASVDDVSDYHEAKFWYLYVQQDFIKLYDWAFSIAPEDSSRLPLKLIKLYSAAHLAKDRSVIDFKDLEIRAQISLSLHFLEHVLLAEMYLIAGRYKSAWRILQSALERHTSDFHADKHLFLLGIIYNLLVIEALYHDDFFQVDQWLFNLNSIIKKHHIEALVKRWQRVKMMTQAKKESLDGILKIWGLDDAKNWTTFTDEWMAGTLGNYYFKKGDKEALHGLNSGLKNEFETVLASQYLEWLQAESLTTHFPTGWSEEQKVLVLPLLYELGEHLSPELVSDIEALELQVRLCRIELSAAVELSCSGQVALNKHFFYYCSALFISALEHLGQSNLKDRMEVLVSIRTIQLVQLCFREDEVPPIYIFDMLSQIASWNDNIQLAVIKGEWRSKPPVSVALFFQVFLTSLAVLRAAEVPTSFGVSFSSSSSKISIDTHFQEIDKIFSNDLITAIMSTVDAEFDELNDGLSMLCKLFPQATYKSETFQTERSQKVWQLDLQVRPR